MSDTETTIIEDLKKQEAELIERASQLFASLDPADIARNLGFQYEVRPPGTGPHSPIPSRVLPRLPDSGDS